ncbi:hypothetical protein, partial [Cypionkella sp.]|uniref:hypothetical protein n=1 Tax=Cypionkella sp. TaxID=2811411 RepID=UPI002ABB026E
MGTDETEQQSLTGRAKVRTLFIENLTVLGLRYVKPRKLAVGEPLDWESFQHKLEDRLAYLPPDVLHVLAEVVLRLAGGVRRDEWPTCATILNNAALLCEPPDDERLILTTWFTSRGGPPALHGGYLVELHSHLRKHPRAPSAYELHQLRERAADNKRRCSFMEELLQAGRADDRPDDVAWYHAYTARLTHLEQLVR